MRFLSLFALSLAMSACFRVGPAVPDNQSSVFCLAQKDWPRFLATMDQFGGEHSMTRHGGVQQLGNNSPILNTNLDGGYDFIFWGTDFDLLVVTDPYRPEVTGVTLVHRDEAPTKAQWEIGHEFLKRIRPLTSPAAGSLHDPTCV
jgi:hypothetical protein